MIWSTLVSLSYFTRWPFLAILPITYIDKSRRPEKQAAAPFTCGPHDAEISMSIQKCAFVVWSKTCNSARAHANLIAGLPVASGNDTGFNALGGAITFGVTDLIAGVWEVPDLKQTESGGFSCVKLYVQTSKTHILLETNYIDKYRFMC